MEQGLTTDFAQNCGWSTALCGWSAGGVAGGSLELNSGSMRVLRVVLSKLLKKKSIRVREKGVREEKYIYNAFLPPAPPALNLNLRVVTKVPPASTFGGLAHA